MADATGAAAFPRMRKSSAHDLGADLTGSGGELGEGLPVAIDVGSSLAVVEMIVDGSVATCLAESGLLLITTGTLGTIGTTTLALCPC